MKLFVKLMLAVLVIGLLLPFTLLKGNNGETMLSFSDFELPDFKLPDISLPEMPDSDAISTSNDSINGKDIFYKWYDTEGNVQFTTEPPPEGIEYTTKGYDPDTNVIQAVKVPKQETETNPVASSQKNTENPATTGSPYSKESIEKLFEDTKNIEEMLNQRLKNQQSAINQ